MPETLTRHRASPVDHATWDAIGAAITRRDVLIGGAALAALAAVGACGDDDTGAPGATTFGTEVEHRYGTTRVPGLPERIVTVGLVDHDAVLALGTVPVSITTDAYSDGQPHGVWPWARDLLGDAAPEVLSATEVNFEAIAALEPDLILAVCAGITEADYETLSAIAPTVAQPAGHPDYQAPWDVMTRLIGQGSGRRREPRSRSARSTQRSPPHAPSTPTSPARSRSTLANLR